MLWYSHRPPPHLVVKAYFRRRSSHCQVVNQFWFTRKSVGQVVPIAHRARITSSSHWWKNTYFQNHKALHQSFWCPDFRYIHRWLLLKAAFKAKPSGVSKCWFWSQWTEVTRKRWHQLHPTGQSDTRHDGFMTPVMTPWRACIAQIPACRVSATSILYCTLRAHRMILNIK